MKKIAVIPARSGSKGLKDKNIKDVCGKPMMAWTIEAALESGVFDRVLVSTDSAKYGEIAKAYGAEVVYRGERVSNDTATTFMVLEELLGGGNLEVDFDYFILLQPTSPMRTAKNIREAAEKFEKNFDRFDFLVSVKKAEHGSDLLKPLGEDGSMKYFDQDYSNYRRQNYNEYMPNGAILIAKPTAYLEQKHFYGARSLSYIMNDLDSLDVDNEITYEFVCYCMRKRLEGSANLKNPKED
jgi:CMP-N-acetylneuraminic acid synthetase